MENYLSKLKSEREQLLGLKPGFKPQYGNKHKTQTMREIAEHSNVHEIEIHPNIIDELIQRERLDRANAFVKSKLAKLTASELADLQVEVQVVMYDHAIEEAERKILETPAQSVVSEEVALNGHEESVDVSNLQAASAGAEKVTPIAKGKKK